ncbi:MAG TPA: TRAP transporter TatT component family protein [Elusimicrobiales bacterium]|nr:TRAP transporter TatT component family protein [Elusimicrobiales bacterium]
MKKTFLILSVSLTCACSFKQVAVKSMAAIMTDAMPVYLQEEDIQTAKETMLPAVKMSESLLESDTDNQKLLKLTAKGYCGYSFAFLEDKDNKRSGAMYKKGLTYSTRLLENKNIIAEKKINFNNIKFKDTPAVFWHAFCLAGFVKLNLNDPSALSRISGLEKIIETLIEINPSYYYNASYALKGAILARSNILGGNLQQSKHSFEMSLKGEGAKFKINKLLYAKTYAQAVLDRELFEKLLNEILDAPLQLPQENMLNIVAEQKAQKLLGEIDEIF